MQVPQILYCDDSAYYELHAGTSETDGSQRMPQMSQSSKSDEDIKKLLDKYQDLFRRLATGVLCPVCGEVAYPPFVNLGEAHNWAEGHERCK